MSHPILQWEVKDDCSFWWFWWSCWASLFELFFSFFMMVFIHDHTAPKKLLIFRHQQVTEKWRRKNNPNKSDFNQQTVLNGKPLRLLIFQDKLSNHPDTNFIIFHALVLLFKKWNRRYEWPCYRWSKMFYDRSNKETASGLTSNEMGKVTYIISLNFHLLSIIKLNLLEIVKGEY